jgi:hypothetical protein
MLLKGFKPIWVGGRLLIGVCLVLVLPVIEEARQQADGSWPLMMRYEVRRYDGPELITTEVHEFRGDSWEDWTDVVVATGGPSARDDQRGLVTRFRREDALTTGWLHDVPVDGVDGFLPDAVFSQFPQNAVSVSTDPQDGRLTFSPNELMRDEFADHLVDREDRAVDPVAGWGLAVDLPAELPPADAATAVVQYATCPAATVAACAPSGQVQTRQIVYEPRTHVPLYVRFVLSDGTAAELRALEIRYGAA